jgi:hypothetical protein
MGAAAPIFFVFQKPLSPAGCNEQHIAVLNATNSLHLPVSIGRQ